MKKIRVAGLFLAVSCVWASAWSARAAGTSPSPGLTAGPNGTVLRVGKPCRAVGVNYFGCFLRTLQQPDDTSYEAGFRVLGEREIPFARFCATGFWPVEMALYRTNRAEYWRRMDGVVRAAERHGVGLIPSLFWHYPCLPDLAGEPMDQWGNPQSRTHSLMREYVREMVTRYLKSPAIWAWEFGNEYNLACDLPNASQHRPPVWKNLGTASERSARDELTYDIVVTAFRAFAAEIRKHDPSRLICGGDAMPRASAWHNRQEKTWTRDTPAQFAEMIALMAPAPIDLLSVHCYEEDLKRVGDAAAAARRLGKPLFVGEFQVARGDQPEGRKPFEDFLAQLEAHRVPLAAVWVFDYGPQDRDFNITGSNRRAWQLDALRDWNRRQAR